MGWLVLICAAAAVILTAVGKYRDHESTERAKKQYDEELSSMLGRIEDSAFFREIYNYMAKEVEIREEEIRKSFDPDSDINLQNIEYTKNNWKESCRYICNQGFYVTEEGLYRYAFARYSDDADRSSLIIKYRDLGYAKLESLTQVEALTTALCKKFPNFQTRSCYDEIDRECVRSYSRSKEAAREQNERIARLKERASSDPQHIVMIKDDIHYKLTKKVLCYIMPTEAYVEQVMNDAVLKLERNKRDEGKGLKKPF